MGLSTKIDKFQYTAGSTSNIVLSGWGFQPKALILHWVGIASASDSTAAGDIIQGWGFADGTRQNCTSRHSVNGGASSDGGTYARGDAVVCVASAGAVLDGYITVSTLDSGGVTFAVPDAISVNLTVMVIAIGGTDITNIYTGTDTDNTVTGNKSNSAVGFLPDIILFAAAIDANNAYPGGSASEDGISFGVAKASGAGNQYVASVLEDDGSANMDTGSYIFDNEFLASSQASTPANMFARKQFVSMDTNGFTWNQLELPQTAGSQFNFLAIKGGTWYVGDLLTQTDTTTTVTETGMSASPALIIMASVSKAKSTQDTGTAGLNMSFGAATSTSERMVLAVQDENGTANAELSRGVEYDEIYANISTSDVIQGLGDISAINSDGFSFIMDDADPSQAFAWWVVVGASVASANGILLQTQASNTINATGALSINALVNQTQASHTLNGLAALVLNALTNQIQANNTAAITGTLLIQGVVNQTQADNSLTATGSAAIVSNGVLSVAQADNVLTSTATLALNALVNQTQANDILNATAALAVNALVNQTQAGNTIIATGVLALKAVVNQSQSDNNLISTGALLAQGVVNQSQANNSLVATGTSLVTTNGILLATQADNAIVSTGVLSINAVVSQMQADNVAAITGTLTLSAIVNQVQNDNAVIATGALYIQGGVNITQSSDTLTAIGTGIVTTSGVVTITQADHIIVSTATLNIFGMALVTQDANVLTSVNVISVAPKPPSPDLTFFKHVRKIQRREYNSLMDKIDHDHFIR